MGDGDDSAGQFHIMMRKFRIFRLFLVELNVFYPETLGLDESANPHTPKREHQVLRNQVQPL